MKRVGGLVVVLVAALAGPARADGPPAPVPPPDDPPPHLAAPEPEPMPEVGLVAGQVLVGVATPVATTLLAAVGGAPTLVVFLLSTPLAVGGVVCGIGSLSDYYDGPCGAPILGAYLGALTIIPTIILAEKYGVGGSEGWWDGTAVLLIAGSWFVVQPLAATLAWHLWKEPRSTRRAIVVPRAPLLPAERAAGRLRAPGEVAVPLISFSF